MVLSLKLCLCAILVHTWQRVPVGHHLLSQHHKGRFLERELATLDVHFEETQEQL